MGMGRRKIRQTIFQLLFRIEFNSKEDVKEQVEDYFESNPEIDEQDRIYIDHKLNAILDQVSDLDEKIVEICDGWKLGRLGKAELTILRLAVYEITEDEDIPTGVAINEAVELAKAYCSDEAPGFINGVLAKLA